MLPERGPLPLLLQVWDGSQQEPDDYSARWQVPEGPSISMHCGVHPRWHFGITSSLSTKQRPAPHVMIIIIPSLAKHRLCARHYSCTVHAQETSQCHLLDT